MMVVGDQPAETGRSHEQTKLCIAVLVGPLVPSLEDSLQAEEAYHVSPHLYANEADWVDAPRHIDDPLSLPLRSDPNPRLRLLLRSRPHGTAFDGS